MIILQHQPNTTLLKFIKEQVLVVVVVELVTKSKLFMEGSLTIAQHPQEINILMKDIKLLMNAKHQQK